MKVRELIELLKTQPQDMEVGYVNTCADDGSDFRTIDEATVRDDQPHRYSGYPIMPVGGAVVLE